MDPAIPPVDAGPDGPIRLDVELPDGTLVASRTLERPCAVVGRDAGADLVVDAPTVSRRHAYFQTIGGRVFCADLQSGRETRWEDGPRPWGWVDPARGVRAGEFLIRPRGPVAVGPGPASGEGDPLPISREFGPPLPEDAVLEAVEGTGELAYWRISRALLLAGRSPSCKVQLAGPGVASIHAAFLRTPGDIWVADLLGPGGSRVNGLPTRWSRLGDGDEVQIGPYRLALRRGPWVNRLRKPNLPAIRTRAIVQPGGRGAHAIRSGPGNAADAVDPTVRALLDEVRQMQMLMAGQFQQALVTMFQMFEGMHREQMDLIRGEMARLHQLAEDERKLRAELEGRPASIARGKPSLRLVGDIPPEPCPPASRPPGPRGLEDVWDREGGGPRDDRKSVASGGDLHAEITRKLAAIQDERQGRWQKLLKVLTGDGAGACP